MSHEQIPYVQPVDAAYFREAQDAVEPVNWVIAPDAETFRFPEPKEGGAYAHFVWIPQGYFQVTGPAMGHQSLKQAAENFGLRCVS